MWQLAKRPATGETTTTHVEVRWSVLGLFSSLVVALLLLGIFGRVDIVSTAHGSLRTSNGPRPVTTRAPGKVSQIAVHAGQRVEAQQLIATVSSAELDARVERSESALKTARIEQERAEAAARRQRDAGVNGLRRKRALLRERAQVKVGVQKTRARRAMQLQKLAREGAAAEHDVQAAAELLAETREELLLLRQQIADIDVEIADRKAVYDTQALEHARRVSEAEQSVHESSKVADVALLTAPDSGIVESLSVMPGQVVEAGAVIARIVPDRLVPSIVVFAPLKDAAYLRAGQAAVLDFASLPVSEYGRGRASVTRVGNDAASATEIAEITGDASPSAEPLVRVELRVEDTPNWQEMTHRLQPGARVSARIETRERRLITLLFDFLLKWFPS